MWFTPSQQRLCPGCGHARPPEHDQTDGKDFRVTERHTIQFRSEFSNIFNHTNFNGVDTTFGDGNFSQAVTAADPRIIEFALRWQF